MRHMYKVCTDKDACRELHEVPKHFNREDAKNTVKEWGWVGLCQLEFALKTLE
jgi:hypothetical protein